MSALLLPALAAGSSGQGALYVDDVFSTYLYTGNGSTQTINNGIDLAGNGGLVWIKIRGFLNPHLLYDTSRGYDKRLSSNTTDAQSSKTQELTSFNSTGFSLGNDEPNLGGYQFISWTFRKAPKFFDVVTYTGDGTSNRQIAHSLGVQVGFVTVKATSTTGDWNSYHRSATGDLKLNLIDAQTASRAIITAADANSFTVSGAANTNGVSYVAYLWAHDPAADGIIQCGSFTTDGGGNATVNLGWEPQYLTVKASSTTGDWIIVDSMRGIPVGSSDARLLANTAGAETSAATIDPSATGFSAVSLTASHTFVYIAIRRPNKPPITGTQVYKTVRSTSWPVNIDIGFPADFALSKSHNSGTNWGVGDRLRGNDALLYPNLSVVEIATTVWDFSLQNLFSQNHATVTPNSTHVLRRATGFFDVVCDTGTGAVHAIAHNLTKSPELIIRKSRSAATQWEVWHSALAATEKLVLNSNAAKATDTAAWNSTLPTATQFTVGTGANVNANTATFVTYLFATLAGISKVGSYTGNGSSQTIDCGFSTGARFFLVKAISTTGSWWVYDSARGIVSAADPALQLNSTAAEITSADAVDPASVGIIVNQEATCSINATGVSYIFLAIA